MSSISHPRGKPIALYALRSELVGYAGVDVTRYLIESPPVLRKLLPILDLVQSRWPNVQAPKQIQAMHGDMSGFWEIRIQIGKVNHRVFFRSYQLESEALILIAAASKIRRSGLISSTYEQVRRAWRVFELHQYPNSLLERIVPLDDPGPQ